MAKGTRGRRGIVPRRFRRTPYPLPSYTQKDDMHKNCSKIFKKDWVDATCSVCMECPHNAVLLLCSSYEKGCRPYMCGTSFRYSNCLDQYKQAYTNSQTIGQLSGISIENHKSAELACPLCRGQVKGWTIVEPAREHLNAKKRSCMQDNCSFVGTFKELRKHVRAEHPLAKPREVDPTLEQKWRGMEREREREDVMSTIRSSIPGAVFFGDYAIEGNHGNRYDLDSEDEDGFDADEMRRDGEDLMSMFLFLETHLAHREHERDSNNRGSVQMSRGNTVRLFDDDTDQDSDNDDDGNYGMSFADRVRRQGGVVLRRSGRRRRRRQVNESGNRL